MIRIISDFPWWAWLLCFGLGTVYALALYLREKKLDLPASWVRYMLMLARFIVASIIAILLLEPYIRTLQNEKVLPELLVIQDNSASVGEALPDTSVYLNTLTEQLERLNEKFEVTLIDINGEDRSGQPIPFSGQSTDLGVGMRYAAQMEKYGNLSAVLLATDGIYNSGEDPVSVGSNLKVPVYTLAIGDTTSYRDARVVDVQSNRIVFTGDRFVVRADVSALLLEGVTLNCAIGTSGRTKSILQRKTFLPSSDNDATLLEFELVAGSPGVFRYEVSIDAVDGESNLSNNSYEVIVEVLDARQKILLVYKGPHPDVSAIQSAIAGNRNYELVVQKLDEYEGAIRPYSLVILHGLPDAGIGSERLLNDLSAVPTPYLIITGDKVNRDLLNRFQNLVTLGGDQRSGNDVMANGNIGFNLFTMEDLDAFSDFPPLFAPYGEYGFSPNSQVLFFQRIGSVGTRNPLMVYSQPGERKTVVLCAENIWRWRIYDYIEHDSHRIFDDWIGKTVQYLATKEDNKQFRVLSRRPVYNSNERIGITAELYNETYEPINTPEASCVIVSEDGSEYPFGFTRTGSYYSLDAGFLPPGDYRVFGEASYNNRILKDTTRFSVKAVQFESANMIADHNMLYRLADGTGGRMFYPDQWEQLTDELLQEDKARPLLLERVRTLSVINLQWILFLLIGLLGVEWFVRKLSGGY